MPNIPWKLIGYVLCGVLAVYLAVQAYTLLTSSSKTKARLGENQTEAAGESGADAVNTVGDQTAGEAETDKIVKGKQDAVDNADGIGAVDNAGHDGLCATSPDLCE